MISQKKKHNKFSPFADLPADCGDTCLPCCFQPSGTGSLSHGHFAGLYYWLIAFKLSALTAPLPSGDCLVGRQGARAAATTQLCCTHAASVSCCMHCTLIRLTRRRFTHKSRRLTLKVSAREHLEVPPTFNSQCHIIQPPLFFIIIIFYLILLF